MFHSTLYLSHYISSSISICQSINRPLPFPKFQYIIAAEPGASISLVLTVLELKASTLTTRSQPSPRPTTNLVSRNFFI